jgi:hypothetical protein
VAGTTKIGALIVSARYFSAKPYGRVVVLCPSFAKGIAPFF